MPGSDSEPRSRMIDRRSSAAAERDGFALASVLSGKTLDGVSFENYVMAFPADVTVKTTAGAELSASQDVPLGGAGRPWDETRALVENKFRANYPGSDSQADEIVTLVDSLEDLSDVSTLAEALSS